MIVLQAKQLINRCLIPCRVKNFITSHNRPVTYSFSSVLKVVVIPGQKSYVNVEPIPWIDFNLTVVHIVNETAGPGTHLSIPFGFVCICVFLYFIFRLYGNTLTRRDQFNSSSVHAEFVVNKVCVGLGFFEYFRY